MASFFSKIMSIFSGSQPNEPKANQPIVPHSHGECVIYPTPIAEGGQYRLAGRIEKMVNGEVQVHEFVRADTFSNHDDAVEFTVRKARLLIDQSGDTLFR
jgi:hypothetical protein